MNDPLVDPILDRMRRVQPSWRAAQKQMADRGLQAAPRHLYARNVVTQSRRSVALAKGSLPVNSPQSIVPPRMWPDPGFPPDVPLSSLPPNFYSADFLLVIGRGQDVGFPDSYGIYTEDICEVYHHHTDISPFDIVGPEGHPLNDVFERDGFRFWVAEARFPRSYSGPDISKFFHSNFDVLFGGFPPYKAYTDDLI